MMLTSVINIVRVEKEELWALHLLYENLILKKLERAILTLI